MKDKSKSKELIVIKEPRTGKIQRRKSDDFDFLVEFDDVSSEDNQDNVVEDNQTDDDIIRKLSCPYQFDNPKVYKELTKPFKTAKFTCEVDVEISLAANHETEHEHNVRLEVDKSRFPADADLSEHELDWGLFHCGMSYNITPRIQVTLLNQELIEDKKVFKYREKIEEEAAKLVDRVCPAEIEINTICLDNYQKLFVQMYEYFQKHLVKELERVGERLAFELHTLNERGEERETDIGIILDEEAKVLRKRLLTAKGRVPNSQQDNFRQENEKFLGKCFEAFAELEKKKKKLNKTELVKIVFDRYSNPHQTLRRKLNDLGLSFEEVLHKYSEQKLT